MTLRRQFLIYLALIHLVFFVASGWFLWHHRAWMFAAEAFFVLSGIVGWRLVLSLTRPLELVVAGTEMMKSSDFTSRFREVGQPEMDHLIRLYNEMIDNLREERVLSREQESLLQRIMSVSPSAMISLDLDGVIHSANPAAESLLAKTGEQLTGRKLDDLGEPIGVRLSQLEENETAIVTLRGRRRIRCRRLAFFDRGFARPFFLMDELTQELHESEKAAYEKLIRMMSHEINNTSGAVISLLESCQNYAGQIEQKDRDDFAEGLRVATLRTRHMNEFMRAFADVVRLPPPRRSACDVVAVLRDIRQLLQPQLEQRRIGWQWEIQDDFPRVSADEAQLEQALLNVVKNSMEAIDQEGTLVVRAHARPRPTVEIEDTGGGIPPEVEESLFTSFFTNKPGGQGIGLTLVQEILLAHGFDYSLETVEGDRARFTVEM